MVQRGHSLRDRRRGRFDPGRRGAHAADHLRPARRPLRPLQRHRRSSSRSSTRPTYELDEKQRTVDPDRGRQREDRAAAARRPACSRAASLYDVENVTIVHHVNQALARPQAVPARQGLHRPQRRGRHHRRVHRPHDAGPALFGRPAPGARGQGARRRSSPRTRRSPRSPSRTISASTRSSPA